MLVLVISVVTILVFEVYKPTEKRLESDFIEIEKINDKHLFVFRDDKDMISIRDSFHTELFDYEIVYLEHNNALCFLVYNKYISTILKYYLIRVDNCVELHNDLYLSEESFINKYDIYDANISRLVSFDIQNNITNILLSYN